MIFFVCIVGKRITCATLELCVFSDFQIHCQFDKSLSGYSCGFVHSFAFSSYFVHIFGFKLEWNSVLELEFLRISVVLSIKNNLWTNSSKISVCNCLLWLFTQIFSTEMKRKKLWECFSIIHDAMGEYLFDQAYSQ